MTGWAEDVEPITDSEISVAFRAVELGLALFFITFALLPVETGELLVVMTLVASVTCSLELTAAIV